jgi:hypothetical protein
MIFDMLDAVCAENLKTDVEIFVKKIEATTEWRREVIINYALDDDNKQKLEQARRCFNLINCS